MCEIQKSKSESSYIRRRFDALVFCERLTFLWGSKVRKFEQQVPPRKLSFA